jgi:hypothetical protein
MAWTVDMYKIAVRAHENRNHIVMFAKTDEQLEAEAAEGIANIERLEAEFQAANRAYNDLWKLNQEAPTDWTEDAENDARDKFDRVSHEYYKAIGWR